MATSDKPGGYVTDEDYSSTITYNFKWTINNFEFVCKNVKVIKSRQFSTKNFNDGKWIIMLEPTELIGSNNDVFKIHLIFDDQKFLKSKKLLNLEISFKRRDNLEIVKSFFPCTAYDNRGENNILWEINAKDLLYAFIDSAPRDQYGRKCRVIPISIDVTCEINILDNIPSIIKKSLIDIENCNNEIIDNIKSLLHNEEFKDVTFNVEDKKFTAHKNILAIRSPVFAAMFKNKMTEGLTSVVEINDIKPAIFQQLLNFIYTDRVKNLEESAFELIYVAEKYQLEKLKNLCINSLNEKLSINTVSKTLEVADFYSIENLKNECLKFVNDKRYEIIETKEFQKLLLDRPNLSIDILKIKETRRNECYEYYELR
ncbi:speckle-type POZ protein-like [Leptopilina heterotoma]|uniref:speckle-type POZ protein-like n=1 Tax=Leptopilina heterotoma TaxID=63436 RepID=UPI001CAA19A8|nr:speckle-type POZ protein-like [Leptopilina heterotoma]